ncbi:MAG: integrase arm-type DNA-binding domain-containing protein [Rhodanobacter sp.]|jgi:integrase|nr:integrase arm-type DNA-binding domain-containing protein [Rhodanobacter sp.]
MLTEAAIKNAKPGIIAKGTNKGERTEKPYKLADARGMYLEVQPGGGKWWRLKYRFGGREKRLSLGVFPDVSLADARARRDEARKLLSNGIDPGAHRKAEKAAGVERAANSFETVAREWLAVKAHEWMPGQHAKEHDRLQNHAFPWIGGLPIASVGVAEIRPLINRIAKRGHLEQAHRLRFQISRIFQFAVATERAASDPAHALRAVLPSRRKQHYSTITDPAKVAELLRAIDGFSGQFVTACALRLSPMLFCRPGELRAATWDEVQLDHPDGPQWVIQPARRKLRRAEKEDTTTPPHVVPLAAQAVAILRELYALTGRGKYLFPGARDAGRPLSDGTIGAALRRLGYGPDDLVPHGFRHMASTLLHEQGFNSAAIERQLSHKEPGVRGVYNMAEHLPERRRMMQAWADYLDGLRAGANVVPFRRIA